MIQFNIIKNDDDYILAWDKFSNAVSVLWDWNNDDLPLSEYTKFFDNAMAKEGIVPNRETPENGFVIFKSLQDLTMFLLKWS